MVKLTTIEIARLYHGRKSASYHGRPAWQAKCPVHRDRSPSLSITEPERGKTKVHCFRGCDDEAVLAAKGLKIADLYVDVELTPETIQRMKRDERLQKLERRLELAIMMIALEPAHKNYWRAVERGVRGDIQAMREADDPNERFQREIHERIQREGFDKMWESVPQEMP